MHTALVSHETSSGPSNNVIGVPGEEKLWGMIYLWVSYIYQNSPTIYLNIFYFTPVKSFKFF